jgi:cytochrome c-type biogenesis protein
MNDLLGFGALAFVAGGISILTPCCLPLLPGYLSYVGGLAAGERGQRKRVLGAAALFVLGFSVVFTALGAAASVLGAFLLGRLPFFVKLAGVFVILLGLATLGVLRLPFLYRERRPDLRRIRSGPAGALPLGMAFAFGWTPCVGPVLGAILTTAGATQTAGKGALLLFIYSLGMGIPFLGFALASTTGRSFRLLRRHGQALERAGGVLLVAIGLLLVTGYWQQLFTPLVRFLVRKGWPPI